MSCSFPHCICDVHAVGCQEIVVPFDRKKPVPLVEQVRRLRERGYEVAEILRKGTIMTRESDGASVLVSGDGVKRLDWGDKD